MSSDGDLKRLRHLLLGSDYEQVDELAKRVADPEARAKDVAEVIVDASILSQETDREKLAVALQAPVTKAMNRSIEQDPENLANILFPVMMPAIRRAIADTMRQFTERVDTILSQQLSAQGLKWRVEALTSGVPFREIVLRETLQFQVEQVLLIENGSGLLMQHLQLPELENTADSDAVSGMLWAIENFVRDSFTQNPDHGLSRVTMEGHIVYLKHGPEATLACVIRGVATPEYTTHMDDVVSELHALHLRQLRSFDGDKESLATTQPLLRTCFQQEYRESSPTSKSQTGWIKKLFLLVLIAALGWLGWNGYKTWEERQKVEKLMTELNSSPGIVMLDAKKNEDTWQLRGMRDPQSVNPESLLAQSSLNRETVSLEFVPFISLEPEMRLPRLRRELKVPESVKAELNKDTLILSGKGELDWVDRVRFLSELPEGLTSLKTQQLSATDDSVAAFIRDTLALPESAEIQVEGKRAHINTTLPVEQKDEVRALNATLDGLVEVSVEQWIDYDQLRIDELLSQTDRQYFVFSKGDKLTAESIEALEATSQRLEELETLLTPRGKNLRLTITGYSSPEGNADKNQQIREARAGRVRDFLSSRGVKPNRIITTTARFQAHGFFKRPEDARRAHLQIEVIDNAD